MAHDGRRRQPALRKKQECIDLRPSTVRNRGRTVQVGFYCAVWKVVDVEQVAAVRPDAVPAHQGPAPRVGVVPALAVGRGLAGSGASEASGFWLDAGVQLQLVPRADRFAGYVSAAYFAIGDQGDLSGVSFAAGPMLALSASWRARPR